MYKRPALLVAGCSTAPKTEPVEGGTATPSAAAAINVYTRDATSGTREAFEKAGDFAEQLTSSAIEVSSNGDMATKVGADENGIGYVSLSTYFAANGVKPLNFEGVAPKMCIRDSSLTVRFKISTKIRMMIEIAQASSKLGCSPDITDQM